MAQYLVTENFEQNIQGQIFRFRVGDLIDDAVGVITAAQVVALRALGLAYIVYNAGTMAAMRAAYLGAHGRDDDPPSLISWLVAYSIAYGVITPTSGVVDPNGVVTGTFGQLHRDTAHALWWVCTSSPTGTVWTRVPRFITTAGNPNTVGGGTAGNIGDVCVDTTNGRVFVNLNAATTGWRCEDDEDLGVVAAIVVTQSGVPVAAQHIDIGADVYTADGAGDFGFAIGAAEATMDNLIHCIQNHATGLYNCVKVDATHFIIFGAATAHGLATPGAPAIAVAENLANYEISAANLNAAGGRANGVSQRVTRVVTVAAGDVTAARVAFMFPFVVARFKFQVRTNAGVLKATTETFTIPAGVTNTVLMSIGTGATPVIATDIVTVEAES